MTAAAAGVVNPNKLVINNEPEELQSKTMRHRRKETMGFKASLGGHSVEMSSTINMDTGSMREPTSGDFPMSQSELRGGPGSAPPAAALGPSGGGPPPRPAGGPAPLTFAAMQQREYLMRNNQPQYINTEPEDL